MPEIIEYQNHAPTNFGLIRNGVEGNYDIVWRMIDLVRDSVVMDKGLEDFVKQLVVGKGYDAFTDTDQLFKFLYDFVKYGDNKIFEGVAYVQDIQGRVESIKDARTTLQDGYGDCDDHAILNATILAMLGFSPCFVISRYPEQQSFQHVYTVVYVNGERYVFDTTLPLGKLNDELKETEIQEFCVFDTYAATDGIQSVFRNLKYLLWQTGKNAEKVVPLLSSVLPFGFLGNSIVRTAFSGTPDFDSLSETGSRVSSELTDTIIELQNNRIPLNTAKGIAIKRYSLFTALEPQYGGTAEYKTIQRKLLSKYNYIMGYNIADDKFSVGFGTNAKLLLGVAVVGIGFLIIKNKR